MGAEIFFFKRKTAYEIPLRLVGSEMCIRGSSHIRIGTFQYAALMGPSVTDRLTRYALARHFPAGSSPFDLFDATVARQAELVANWMRFGFIHGVMNTDNVAISGETIDFGPCAFMDYFATDTAVSYTHLRAHET